MKRELGHLLSIVDASLGTYSTDEQKQFSADFTTPLISFSNPGTGKSHSTIKGLIVAQTYHRIPGKKINAMSFTVESTAELSARYSAACKKCGISPTVTFNTFHKICKEILLSRYPSMQINGGFHWESDLATLAQYMTKREIAYDDMFYVKKVFLAIDKLNHSLVYEDRHVELSYDFKQLDMEVSEFQSLRRDLFINYFVRQTITQGDIPMYALYVLLTNPDIAKKYRDKFDVMVVDEFQDMTKLYLVILSIISKNLIVIGDMKQQIYGFNGASEEIVQEFKRIYPNAREINLTESFRCRNEIVEFASSIIKPNDPRIIPFKGTGDGGEVSVLSSKVVNFKEIVQGIAGDIEKARFKREQEMLGHDVSSLENGESTMFLCRNNFSITPIVEEMFRQDVPYRVKKLMKVMDLPIYRELCILAQAACNPREIRYVELALRLFPEFRQFNEFTNPFILAMRAENKSQGEVTSMFNLSYRFREESSLEFFNCMRRAREAVKVGKKASDVFHCLMPVYEKYIIEKKWWKLDMEKEFYDSLVSTIITTKTYPTMYQEELEKEARNQNYVNAGVGVRCYTMHSAKGLEADNVYILDAESVFYPSRRNFQKLVDAGCDYEAARLIREERNLLYVGITRAKKKCVITYSEDLTPLVSNPDKNCYTYLDEIFLATHREFDDVGSFLSLLKLNLEEGQYGTKVAESKAHYDDDDEISLESL